MTSFKSLTGNEISEMSITGILEGELLQWKDEYEKREEKEKGEKKKKKERRVTELS